MTHPGNEPPDNEHVPVLDWQGRPVDPDVARMHPSILLPPTVPFTVPRTKPLPVFDTAPVPPLPRTIANLANRDRVIE